MGDAEESEMEFSLVTGTYRTRRTFGERNETPSIPLEGVQALSVRNKEFSLAKLESAGSAWSFLFTHQAKRLSGHYLSTREFQGLDPRHGMDEPAALEEGRSGIAKGYGGETHEGT